MIVLVRNPADAVNAYRKHYSHGKGLYDIGSEYWQPATLDHRKFVRRYIEIFATLYSSTETFGITRFNITANYKLGSKPMPAGFPVRHKSIQIVDEQGRAVANGQLGEITVTSQFLSPGYWNNPKLTAERFRHSSKGDGVRTFFTGDLGIIDKRVRLHIRGRKDRQTKIRGYRIEIESVEMVLRGLDAIKEVAVIAKDNFNGEKRLYAYLIIDQKKPLTIRQLQHQAAQLLSNYMLPSGWYFCKRQRNPRHSKSVHSSS